MQINKLQKERGSERIKRRIPYLLQENFWVRQVHFQGTAQMKI